MITADVIGAVVADGWQMHDGAGSGWWMAGMGIWMVVFWAAIVVGLVWLVRLSLDGAPRRGEEALGVLDRRFAEGAISLEEYRERKAFLLSQRARRPRSSAEPAESKEMES